MKPIQPVYQIFGVYPQKYQPYNTRLIEGLQKEIPVIVVSFKKTDNFENKSDVLYVQDSFRVSISVLLNAIKLKDKSFKSAYKFCSRFNFIIQNPKAVFHFHNLQTINDQLLDYMIKFQIRFTISLRGFDVTIYPLLSDKNQNKLSKILRHAWRVHSVCKSLVNNASQYFDQVVEKTFVIYRSPNLNDVLDFQPKPKLSNEINILSLSRVHWKKCVSESLIALKKLKVIGYDVKYHIIGGFQGDERNRLLYLIKKLNLQDSVILYDFMKEKEYKKVLCEIDLCWMPTINEGLPNTLYFLLKSGIPTISSSTDGIPEVVEHKHNGLLFSPYDFDDLVDKTLELINNDALRISISQNAKRTALQTLENEIKQYKELYESK